jgi:hypothetical protein
MLSLLDSQTTLSIRRSVLANNFRNKIKKGGELFSDTH